MKTVEEIKEKYYKILFKIFWKITEEQIKNDNNTYSLQNVLQPRFGRMGAIIWFFLTDDGKWVLEDSEDADTEHI